jgi:hypothetical protein
MFANRLLRPSVCSCELGCRSREEMRARHGTPSEFENGLADAIGDGMISLHEAELANRKYRKEWAEAPEWTEVKKP